MHNLYSMIISFKIAGASIPGFSATASLSLFLAYLKKLM